MQSQTSLRTTTGEKSVLIQRLSAYMPPRVVDNIYFSRRTGRPAEWFVARTGILERRRAAAHENCGTMAVTAARALAERSTVDIATCDLVIGVSYTPWDTIATIGHHVQRALGIDNARVFHVSAACTSALVAIEIASTFFAAERAKLALVVAAEHNSLYSDDSDDQSGHLWGDAAAAILISPESAAVSGFEVVDVLTSGLGHIGQGPEGVYLRPKNGGLSMPHGKDVFTNACRFMEKAAREMLNKHEMSAHDVRLLVPHQANLRIVQRVASRLGFDAARCGITVTSLGNTGCVSPLVTLAHYQDQLERGDYALLVAFGGGYSAGAALLRKSG